MRREERNKSTLITGFLIVLLIQALAEAEDVMTPGTPLAGRILVSANVDFLFLIRDS